MEYIKSNYSGFIFNTSYTQVFKNKPTTPAIIDFWKASAP